MSAHIIQGMQESKYIWSIMVVCKLSRVCVQNFLFYFLNMIRLTQIMIRPTQTRDQIKLYSKLCPSFKYFFLNLSFIFCLSVSISNHLKYMESIRIGLQPSSIKLCVIITLNQLQLLFCTILFFKNSTLVKVYTFLFILVMNWLW